MVHVPVYCTTSTRPSTYSCTSTSRCNRSLHVPVATTTSSRSSSSTCTGLLLLVVGLAVLLLVVHVPVVQVVYCTAVPVHFIRPSPHVECRACASLCDLSTATDILCA